MNAQAATQTLPTKEQTLDLYRNSWEKAIANVKLSNKSLEGLINLKAQENQFIRDELARFNNIDNASRKRIQTTTNNIRNSTLQERIARIRNSDKVDLQLTIINKNLTCLTENFGNPEKCGNDIFNPDEIEVK